MKASIPMPTTGADYRWMNLMARVPRKGLPLIAKRLAQGVGGLMLGRRYTAGGQALAAGLFAGVVRAGVGVGAQAAVLRFFTDGGRGARGGGAQGGRGGAGGTGRGGGVGGGGCGHNK